MSTLAQAATLLPQCCFVVSNGASQALTPATSPASMAMTAPLAYTRVWGRSRGLLRCFLGLSRNGNSGGKPQSPPVEEQDVNGVGSTSTTMRRREFVVTPHHHGNSHLEGLLNLAGREKEEFAGALVKLEHHMQLEVAEALIFNIRKYTNGGMLPSADGSLPKLRPDQQEVVTEFIPEVMRIMDRLEQQGHHHRDARVALYATEALSYEVSTKNVVKAAPQLARIFKNIDMMVAKHPELKGGAPFIIQGMMFLNAPIPVRSVKKAKECFQSAHRIDATSPRNNYFCGVTAYLEKDYTEAHTYFAESLRLAQEAAAIASAVRKGVALSGDGGGGERGGGCAEAENPANKEMPMDEYLHVQCRLGMDLASSRIK